MTLRRVLPRRVPRRALGVRPGRALPVVGLAAAALIAAGCGPVRSGAALIIGDERVPISEVQARVTKVTEQRAATGQQPQTAKAITQEQVRRIILTRILERAAAETGVTVTQAEIDAQRSALEQQAGGAEGFGKQVAEANILPGELNDFLRSVILEQKIGQALVPNVTSAEQQQERSVKENELVSKVAKEMGITVNPRYGRWNPDEFAIEPALGGFVKPEHEAPATSEAPVPQ